MKLKAIISAVLLSATIFAPACDKLIHKSPAEVITSMYMACNAGKYSDAARYFSSNGKALINSPMGAAEGGVQGLCDRVTRNGTLQRVEILGAEVRGEGAKVYYIFHFKDGSTKSDQDDLIQENGEWKSNPSSPSANMPPTSEAPREHIQYNQKSAVGTLRTIDTAEVTYVSMFSVGYSRTLAQLGPPASGENPTTDRSGMVDSQTASGVKNGYEFVYKPGPLVMGRIDTYTVVARPLQYGVTGINSYYTDQSGVSRETRENREATANDSPIAG